MHNIFVNDVTTAARRRALLAERLSLETEIAPDHELRLEALDVLAAIRQLPEEFRAALCLVTLEDFSYEEAANILGVPVGTLMSRLHRARVQLRDMTGAEARPRLKRVK
jgi:RNA polymerase sigma-70 factor (ECF subfamily)